MPKNITLTTLQLCRLLNSIKETNPTLFSQIETDTSKMCGVYALYDGNGSYQLEFTNISYSPSKLYNISWEPASWVHNYIFYGTRKVD